MEIGTLFLLRPPLPRPPAGHISSKALIVFLSEVCRNPIRCDGLWLCLILLLLQLLVLRDSKEIPEEDSNGYLADGGDVDGRLFFDGGWEVL